MIYENICKLAKERGISINKLEEKANVSTGSICKWGNSVSPTVKNIKKVCRATGWSRKRWTQNHHSSGGLNR